MPIPALCQCRRGKLRGSTGSFPSRHQFTCQYIDDSGLYYYNSRYYDPQTGVFISPDTVVPDAGNVFDYNRYMMVRGNPLKYNDPSGHLSEDEVNRYFGFDSKEAMAEVWGEGVAGELYGTDFTWGDVLNHDGGASALMLFYNEGTYEGGFWGITGGMSGRRVSSDVLLHSSQVSTNLELSKQLHEGSLIVPNQVGADGQHYPYYHSIISDMGVRNWAMLAVDIVDVVWFLADGACKFDGRCSIPAPPTWLHGAAIYLTVDSYYNSSNYVTPYYTVSPAYNHTQSPTSVNAWPNVHRLTRPMGTHER